MNLNFLALRVAIVILIMWLFAGCEPGDLVTVTPSPQPQENPESIYSSNPVQEINFNNEILSVQEIDSVYLYQGDILLSKENRKASIKNLDLWVDNTIPYVIDGALTDQTRVFNAMAHWEAKTNIRFVPRTSAHRDYIYFTPGSGCSSYIGRVGYRQAITLSPNCSTGNTIHEIGHAVGLWHEQARQDRDTYLKIWFENITAGYEHNFNKWTRSSTDVGNLDFGSIMMYGPYSFSATGKPTITKLDGSLYTFQRTGLSAGDIAGVLLKYPGAVVPEPTPPPAPAPVTDTDGDGVPDTEDKCISVPGPTENNGCPWPDTDKDGTLDKDDKCPSVAGPKENNGCPWPDTDGDGVTDNIDKCITQAGPASNNGCPVIVEPVEPKPTKPNKERPVRGKPDKKEKPNRANNNSDRRN